MIRLNKSFRNTFKEYQFICYNLLNFLQCDIFCEVFNTTFQFIYKNHLELMQNILQTNFSYYELFLWTSDSQPQNNKLRQLMYGMSFEILSMRWTPPQGKCLYDMQKLP